MFRSSNRNFGADRSSRKQQRVRHVIAIADVSKVKFLEIAEMLLQSKEVSQRLARMLEFAERIDHWNTGVGRHLLNHRMAEGAQHDDVDPALQVVGDVIERLARIEAARRLIKKECAAAKAVHPGFKRKPRAQRWLFEEHHHLLARKNAAKIRRPLFEHGGEIEKGENFGGGKVMDGDEIARRNRLRQQVRRMRLGLHRRHAHKSRIISHFVS